MLRANPNDNDQNETEESPHLSTFLHNDHYIVVDYVDEMESFCIFFPALDDSLDERIPETVLVIGPNPKDARKIYDLLKERAKTVNDPVQLLLDAQNYIAAEVDRQTASDQVFRLIEDLPN